MPSSDCLSVPPSPGVWLSENVNIVSAPCKFNNLRIVYTNCRSLRKKLVEFEHSIIEEKANLVAVTETWFSHGNEMNIPGYDGYYSSRSNRKGGGVAIYINRCLSCSTQLIKSDSEHGFDMVIIKIHLCDKVLLVCVIYRPPNISYSETTIMCDTIRSTISSKELIIMGDLNLPGIDWKSNNLLDVCPKHR